MNDIDKILIKLSFKAKRKAIQELLKEYKDDKVKVKKLNKMLDKLPSNV